MEKFKFIINFALDLITKYDNLADAKKMIMGCNSHFNISDLGHSRKVQNMINNLDFASSGIITDINHIYDVYQAQENGIIVI